LVIGAWETNSTEDMVSGTNIKKMMVDKLKLQVIYYAEAG